MEFFNTTLGNFKAGKLNVNEGFILRTSSNINSKI